MTEELKASVSYDREADAIGIYFAPAKAEYDSSREVAPGVVVDYDTRGRVIGVALQHVHKLLEQGSLAAVTGG